MFWIPVQPNPPVMSAVDGGRAVARELRGLREGERRVARVDPGRDVLQGAAGVGVEDHVEALAQPALAHVLVHDQRVRDLLVVEDHAHPAGRLRVVPGLQHRQARQVHEVALHVGRARRGVDIDREIGRHALERRAQARLARDDPRPRGIVLAAGREGLLGRFDLEAGEPHARREQAFLSRVADQVDARVASDRALVGHALGDGRELDAADRLVLDRLRLDAERHRQRPGDVVVGARRAPCRPGTSAASGGRARSRGRAGPCAPRRCRPGSRPPSP